MCDVIESVVLTVALLLLWLQQGPVSAGETGEAKFKHITEMTILTVQLTVEFSKRLPGFDTLLREDQITLLKACSSEVMMLRCARRYDTHTDSIVFATNLPYTRDAYAVAGVGETADALFRFGRHMSAMKVDNAEYGLLTAIVIFSGGWLSFSSFQWLLFIDTTHHVSVKRPRIAQFCS